MDETTTRPPYRGTDDPSFGWEEWAVFSTVLMSSVGIGVFFGCFGSKNSTKEEYLLGGRQMHPLPVALSLLCSYVSSITLLGTPVEIYYYGMQLSMVLLCYIPLTLSLAFIYVPHYFLLQYVSIYEYLQTRFNRPLRIFISLVNLVYGTFFASIVVYGPSLALAHVTGINHRLLVAILFTACIFYSTLGGFKAVLWTDSLQATIMFVSMAIVVIVGANKAGGLAYVWERADETGRLNFFNFDLDPRTRHTFWTALIGGYFQWLPMYANQAQIQRYVSLPSMKHVYIALFLNLVGLTILMTMIYMAGLIVYGYYADCDPLVLGRYDRADQLLPNFVQDTLAEYSGIPGLFVAGITCAALSTVSSVVNAMSASVVEDYYRAWRPNASETQLAVVAKIVACICGIVAFAFVYVADVMDNIFSSATSMLGILGSPTFGTFLCGMFFPWANSFGVTTGLITTMCYMTYIGVGRIVMDNKDEISVQLKPLSVLCVENGTKIEFGDYKDQDLGAFINSIDISPLWYPFIGILLSVVLGMLFSFLYTFFNKNKNFKVKKMDYKLFNPLMLKFLEKYLPGEVDKYISYPSEKNVGSYKGTDGERNSFNSTVSIVNQNFEEKLSNGTDNMSFVKGS